jgi:hypothetical protein
MSCNIRFCFRCCGTNTKITSVTMIIIPVWCCKICKENAHVDSRMDIHAVGSISVHLKVVSAKTSQVYNNNVIWITYDCHRNSNKITNLHAQGFIIDSNKITLEKQKQNNNFELQGWANSTNGSPKLENWMWIQLLWLIVFHGICYSILTETAPPINTVSVILMFEW